MKHIPSVCNSFLTLFFMLVMVSCNESDPFVDRVAAPLLVDVPGAPFGAPISAVPSVSYDSSALELQLQVRLLELDKTNILDHTKGIDSIPAPNVTITVSFEVTKEIKEEVLITGDRTYHFSEELFTNNGSLGEFTSDADGFVTFRATYKDFGLEGNRLQRTNDIIRIKWTGTYKGTPFTRISQITVNQH